MILQPEGLPGSSAVKNLPEIQETQEMQVWSLGWEDPLEEEISSHSSMLAWKISWTNEPGWLQSMGSQRAGHDWAHTHWREELRYDVLHFSRKQIALTFIASSQVNNKS